MFEIPEGFLEEETRDDFRISAMMKRTWAAEMKVVSQLKEFFKEHGIGYRFDYGSLLGVVRHKGFIPWDDDIDITMNRKDYMKFLSVRDKLPYPLRAKTIYDNDEDYFNQFHTVICNTRDRELKYDKERMEMYFGCPFILGIDINPFDYIPRNETDRQYQKLLYNIAFVIANRYDKEHDTDAFKRDLEALEKQLGGSFDHSRPLRPQLYQLADKIAMMCPEEDADHVTYYTYMVTLHNPGLRRKEWYYETIELPFEFMEVSVPLLYNKVLNANFGNYMRVVKTGGGHDYPFYSGQVEYFRYMGYDVEE